VGLRGRIEIEPGSPAACAGDQLVRIYVYPPHRREIDHEAVVHDAVSGRVVTASTNRDLQPVSTREVKRGGNVGRAGTACNQRGAAVDESVEAAPSRIEFRVRRLDDCTGQRGAEFGQARLEACHATRLALRCAARSASRVAPAKAASSRILSSSSFVKSPPSDLSDSWRRP
jgi:hypothetical protein